MFLLILALSIVFQQSADDRYRIGPGDVLDIRIYNRPQLSRDAVRVEGNDRKYFFAIAESDNGIDGFRFWDYPILMPETDDPDTNAVVHDGEAFTAQFDLAFGFFAGDVEHERFGVAQSVCDLQQ